MVSLKQAPRAWYSRIDSYLLQDGFEKCPYKHTLYVKTKDNGNILILCLYVDDLIFTGNSKIMVEEFKKAMMNILK